MESSHMLPEFKVEYMKPTTNKRRTLNMGEIIDPDSIIKQATVFWHQICMASEMRNPNFFCIHIVSNKHHTLLRITASTNSNCFITLLRITASKNSTCFIIKQISLACWCMKYFLAFIKRVISLKKSDLDHFFFLLVIW